MSTLEEYRARLNKAAVIIKDLTGKLEATQKKLGEPIAVIGMACRFPAGGVDPDAFWQALEAGVDGVRNISAERWPADTVEGDNPSMQWAGLLEGVDRFDSPFFGISPREAMKLDPQQRLLLEVSWEALERSGQAIDKLMGTRTGVFLGMCTTDYQSMICNAPPYDVYSGLGATFATASGRISYLLGLQGPCVTLDTACSSSLTATHFACQSLRNGESDMALAGGVNLILSPTSMKIMSELQALSPDGRCKTFDAEANGFVRGEGCGIVVLKRLSDAERDGDPILAIIRGSVVNQDGRSTGLTAPNVLSQQTMLRRALEIARIQPEDIGYVETHGTGTSLGDPIEFESMREVLGKPRPDGSTCVLGALKTNVGHMEGAAGIGGLIKAILCLQHEAIPKNLHFNTLNPRLSLEGTPFVIPTETIPWKSTGKPRRAGVSSFGISGTNAHVILEEAPPREEKPLLQASSYLIPLSAKTPEALAALAKSYQEWLLHHDEPLPHIAYTASVRRNHLEDRLSVVGSTKDEIAAALGALVAGEKHASIVTGKAAQDAPKVVFVFPGQGSQWLGMGRQLYREEPVFRDALQACDQAIRKEAGVSIIEELEQPGETSRLQETIVAQPALFAVEVALSALLQSWGITPSAVIGHSVGEIAAAHVAGLLDLEQAARLVCIRAQVMQKATGHGKMVSVSLTEHNAREAIAGLEDRIGIAAVNDPSSVVLSGDIAAIDGIVERLSARGVQTRSLRVNYAFHSPQMDPLIPEFTRALGELVGKLGTIPMISTVTGNVVSNKPLGATYWAQNIRQTVRFAEAIGSFSSNEHHLFVEVGPHPVLAISMELTLAARNAESHVIATLRRDKDERKQALLALGALHVHGYSVNWKRLHPEGARVVPLPTYLWQRQRYWLESSNTTTNRAGEATGHPLLGVRVPAAGTFAAFETVLSLDRYPWLADHRVSDQVLVPAAAMVELMRAAFGHGNGRAQLKSVVLLSPLVLPEKGGRRVQVILGDGGSSASLYSQIIDRDASAAWTLHSTAIANEERGEDSAAVDLSVLRARCTESLEPSAIYRQFARMGLAYGANFRGVQRIWRGEGEAIAEIMLPAGLSIDDYGLHPALLDASLQTMIAAADDERDELALPFEIGEFSLHQHGANAAWVHTRWKGANPPSADITLYDSSGAVVARVLSYRTHRVDAQALGRTDTRTSVDVFYRINWPEADISDQFDVAALGRWIVVATPDSDRAAAITDKLSACIPTTSAGLSAALDQNEDFAGVLCFWERTKDEQSDNGAFRLCSQALSVLQTLQTHRRAPKRLLWVTSGAVGFGGEEAITPELSGVWGLGRTVLQEQPERGLRLMDVAPGAAIDVFVREMATNDDETQVVWRNGRRHVARLVRADFSSSHQVSWAKRGTVLITGGLGALGLHVARWFARHGAPNLLLASRRGMASPGAAEAVAELRALGAQITVAAVDVADRRALQSVLDAIPTEYPLRGVVHAAGVLDDGLMSEQNAERLARVFAPKVLGAWNLHELTVERPLDFFVLFSSVAGLLGTAGQSNYAAANSFLDALATYRRTLGLAGQSIAWGAWSDGGMAAALGSTPQVRLSKQGFKWISSDEGMIWFEKAMTMPDAIVGIIPLDSRRLEQSLGDEIPPVWRALVRTRARRAVARAQSAWAAQLASLNDAQRLNEVRTAVRTDVARILGISTAIRSDQPFNEMGLDSLLAVELRNVLSKRVGKTLPATLAFDYPTIETLSRYLLDDVPAISETHTPQAGSIAAITTDEPIAIVGMGCRYPGGVVDPDSFWHLLDEGIDGITEMPRERWDVDALYDPNPDALGKMTTRSGGFLTDIDRFDPAFFGVSPREAITMDPQQRLLLETSWEALEHAGIVPENLMGTDMGVFVGLMYQDYGAMATQDLAALDGHVSTGSAGSIASGRISYQLGVKGPSLTVDTACSSSLVTVHLACQALRRGECSMALAGGVALMLNPAPFVEFSRLRGLAADGRSKSFSAAADGVAWSEGCGMLVLEKLSDARRHGHRILALIRGSAVNQDGRSNGLTAPNGPSQQEVIRQALEQAGLAPSDIDYVECHGTGTTLGDPIEVHALGAVFSIGHSKQQPVLIGSVKSNLGHTQAAAGAAGIMKVVLAMEHGQIPRNLHFDAPSPHISWSELPLQVAAEMVPWVRNAKSRRAGVSSFGISGTNAHVILEEAPHREAKPFLQASSYLLPLSAKTPEALSTLAKSYHEWLLDHDEPLHDVAYTASRRRSHMECRLSVVGTNKEEVASALGAYAAGEFCSAVVKGKAAPTPPKVAFVFSGQGSQWIGMGRQLYREEPVFREALVACDAAICKEAGISVLEELDKPEETSRLHETVVAQPALFAVEVALSALLRSWGITPSVVIGHSVGEIAAAYVAGMLDLTQAARLVSIRARVMQKATGHGKMVLVLLDEPLVREAIAGLEDRVGIAAVNDPHSVVLSGDAEVIDWLVEKFTQSGVQTRQLRVNYAFHSPHMDSLRGEFVEGLGVLEAKPGTIPMLSTVTGQSISAGELTTEYWARNIRQTVRFAEAIASASSDGSPIFVEIGPHPVLAISIEETLAARSVQGKVIATLRREKDERTQALLALGALHVQGCTVDWSRFYADDCALISLPTYPWQRERYWIESPNGGASATKSFGVARAANPLHPLAGTPFTSSLTPGARLWRQSMSAASIPWLAEHKVQDAVVFPGTGYIECMLEAATETLGVARVLLEDIAFEQMMVFGDDQVRDLEVALIDDGPRKSFRISSQSENASWTRHASGYIRSSDEAFEERGESPHAIASRLPTPMDVVAHYENIQARQLHYGHSFQGIVELRAGEHEALAKIRLPADVPDDGYVIHPALLDACLQVSGAVGASSNSETYVPIGIDQVHLYRRPGRESWVVATKSAQDESARDLRVVDEEGNTLVAIRGLRSKKLEQVAHASDSLADCVYEVAWQRVNPLPEPELASGSIWLVVMDGGYVGEGLAQGLAKLGQRCIRLWLGSSYERVGSDEIRVDWSSADDYRRIFKEMIGDEDRCAGVVFLSSLDATPFEQTTTESLSKDLGQTSVSAAYLTQAIVRHGFRDDPRLFLVTRGAQSVHSTDPVSVSQAPILGLGKTIAMEHPDLRCARIDLPAEASDNDVDVLLRELGSQDREDQIAWRAQSRYVARLVPGRFEPTEVGKSARFLEPARGRPYRLEIRRPGVLDHLELYEMPELRPGPNEVLIDVKAAGLNFLDVLAALGALPPEATGADEHGPNLGGECAGTIVAVGEGVTDIVPGLEVLAMGSRAIGSRVIAQRPLVAKKPPQLSWEEAATIPVVFLTAYYALEHIGRLCAGERVLIHAGAGGVGLAAIQLAKRVGAEVFATAGSDEKRAYLRSLGVPHVLDSRSLRFVDDIKRITGGDGVDVVLNSLSGDFIPASFSIVRDHGRFVEIGKRDYFENKQLGLRPFLRNLSFSLVDLRGLTSQRPERVGTMLRELVAMFEAGSLRPLPVRAFPCSRASEAFQFIAQAKHIGKIALALNDVDAQIVPAHKEKAIAIRADRTYLLTGGLGGLGLSLAQWLVEQGARHLTLVGRSAPSDNAKTALQSLEQAGARVQCVQADVSRESDVEKLFELIRNDMPPVGGIVHAAMVLDDHTLLEQSEESFRKVYAPKALGAWNLHRYSAASELDFFVMYSSAAGLMGSPGQANYCAANTYLDALCRERTRRGLPGMSIQWGAFSEVGAAAARENRGRRLAQRGGVSLSPAEGLEALLRLLKNPRPEVGVARFDSRQWVEFYPSTAAVPFFAEIMHRDTQRKKSDIRAKEILAHLQTARPDERSSLLEKHLTEQVGAVLRIDSVRVDRSAPFQTLGMDSLMSLELRNRLEASLGPKLSATVLFTYPNIDALARYLLSLLVPIDADATESQPRPNEGNDVEVIADMSVQETEAAIEAEIAALEELAL